MFNSLSACCCPHCGAGDGTNLTLTGRDRVKCSYCGVESASRDADNQRDVRDDIRLAPYAEQLGYTVDMKKDRRGPDRALPTYRGEHNLLRFGVGGDGWSFSRGNRHLWRCASGWAVAELVDKHYTRHRYYGRLREALECEADDSLLVIEDETYHVCLRPAPAPQELGAKSEIQVGRYTLYNGKTRGGVLVTDSGAHYLVVGIARRRTEYLLKARDPAIDQLAEQVAG